MCGICTCIYTFITKVHLIMDSLLFFFRKSNFIYATNNGDMLIRINYLTDVKFYFTLVVSISDPAFSIYASIKIPHSFLWA